VSNYGTIFSDVILDKARYWPKIANFYTLPSFDAPVRRSPTDYCHKLDPLRGGIAEWLASPNWHREVVGSNPGVARSDGQ